jgi:hypothetical protein
VSPALGKMPPSLKQLQRRSYLGGHGVLAFGQDALVLDLAVSLKLMSFVWGLSLLLPEPQFFHLYNEVV